MVTRVHLLVPPYTPPMVPNLAIPSLAGALVPRGIEVRQTDLNVRLHHDLLHDAGFLASAFDALLHDFLELDRQPVLEAADCARYTEALNRLGQARLLFPRQQEIARLSKTAAPDREPLPFGYPTQQDAFRLVSAVTGMWGVDRMRLGQPSGTQTAIPTGRAAECLRAFFARHLAAAGAQVFGISLLYDSQAACAALLAQCLREWFPQAAVIAGGAYALRLAREGCPGPLAGSLDALVVGEGEEALLRFCQEWPMARNRHAPRVLDAAAPPPAIPVPSFSAEDAALYWSHPLCLPLQASRGCYWGRCAFCSYADCYSGPYRAMQPAEVARMAEEFRHRLGSEQYQFVDDCASPAFLAGFAAAVSRRGLRVTWSACVRFEQQFDADLLGRLAEAGCRRLTFGLETAGQRLLDAVRKGTRAAKYLPILRACKAAGIATHLNWIAGLPGETPAELEETVRFLTDHADLYAYQFGHLFTLEPGSPFARSPGEFGAHSVAKASVLRSAAERDALFAATASVGARRPAAEPAPQPAGPPGWRSDVARERVSFDLESVYAAARAGTGSVEPLEAPEWAIFNPWSGVWAQFSEDAKVWLESAMAAGAGASAAAPVLHALFQRGLLNGMEHNA